MKTAAVLSLAALTCPCANAFTVSTASLRPRAATTSSRSATSLSMRLSEADFIPSEEWLGEYMGEQGLRYALNKTPEEVEKEGDYSLLEKLFGQTSNNKARMDLKAEVLAKANNPTNPTLYKEWTAKYGYGRFFPVYVDKSGFADDDSAPVAAAPAPAKAVKKAAPARAPAAAKVVAKAGPKVAAKKPMAAPKAVAAPKVAAVRKPAPKKVAAPRAKPAGNINNLPKAL